QSGESIPVMTVDSLRLARCNLIKIDIEGMEPQVLSGARRTIERLRPFIFVETTMVNSKAVIEILTSLRYDCRWHIADYYNPGNYFQNSENVFQGIHPESNMVCFPREASVSTSGLEPVTGPDDNWQLALERIRKK
ncbi:MAG TPA: FkbM family methyltransferase, partial [Terriglobia bacterium]|nr:FkbM family methyltransferase [Terriglobia bacterium]